MSLTPNSFSLNVLIASPGDTDKEREDIKDVCLELNKVFGISKSTSFNRVFLNAITYEDNTRPDVDEYGQKSINKQLDDYDIVIVIIKKNWGTGTKLFSSGTYEEYKKALENRNKKDVAIWNYFYVLSDEDVLQQKKKDNKLIKKFKKEVGDNGGLYHIYSKNDNFHKIINRHILTYLRDFLSNKADSYINLQEEVYYNILKNRYQESLNGLGNVTNHWIEPNIIEYGQIDSNPSINYKNRTSVESLLTMNSNIVIKAPPAFGFTTLSHKLVVTSWELGITALRIDLKETKSRKIDNYIEENKVHANVDSFSVFIIDGYDHSNLDNKKAIQTLCTKYPNSFNIVLNTIREDQMLLSPLTINLPEGTKYFQLLAFNYTSSRQYVENLCKTTSIGDVESTPSVVVQNIAKLNLPRSPLFIQQVFHGSIESEGSINTISQYIDAFMSYLFNLTYSDVQNTKQNRESVNKMLGEFCGNLYDKKLNEFTKSDYIEFAISYCKRNFLQIDYEDTLDRLKDGYIVGMLGDKYMFKAKHYYYYFISQNMKYNAGFKNKLLDEPETTRFPEIIMYYSSIQPNDNHLQRDIREDLLLKSTSITNMLNPILDDLTIFDELQYKSDNKQLDSLIEKMNHNTSIALPANERDEYYDSQYKQEDTYDQKVEFIIEKYEVQSLLNKIKSLSGAFSNSESVEASIKQESFATIIKSWIVIARIFLLLAPLLAKNGKANILGLSYRLVGLDDKSEEDKYIIVLDHIPLNLLLLFDKYAYSAKMAPLYVDFYNKTDDNNEKMLLVSFLLYTRPKDWEKLINNYVQSIHHSSYYMMNLTKIISWILTYEYPSKSDRIILRNIFNMALRKRRYKLKKVDLSSVLKGNRFIPK